MKNKLILTTVFFILITIILTGCLSNPLSSLKELFLQEEEQLTSEEEGINNADPVPEVSVNVAENIQTTEKPQSEENKEPLTTLYYKNSQGLLVPVIRHISKDDLGLAKLAVHALAYSSNSAENLKPMGLFPTLPMNTRVLGASIKEDGTIVLDMSKEITTFTNQQSEIIGINSIVYTLTEFSNINKVQFKIEGREISTLVFGTKISEPLKRTEINLDSDGKTGDKLSKVMVYYQKKAEGRLSYFVPVTKLVSGIENSVEAAMVSLLAGPSDKLGLISPIPKGTTLLGVQVKGGIAYINFSNEILTAGSDKALESSIVKSITLTLREFPQIEKIRIFVDGKTIEDAEGIGSSTYLTLPSFVNYYE